VESIAMRIHADTLTLSANYGIVDRVDIGAALPIERLTLSGQRVDTYRGTQLTQATVDASASGPGDMLLRGKVHVWQWGTTGLSAGAEARLPTGNAANLLGTDRTTIKPRLIVSTENSHVAFDSNIGDEPRARDLWRQVERRSHLARHGKCIALAWNVRADGEVDINRRRGVRLRRIRCTTTILTTFRKKASRPRPG
jgi:hypothetical protein